MDTMRLPSPSLRPARERRERGAVLVHTAVALAGLIAFSALTIDLGVLWVARTQAQNAADAGAMAGAVSLAYGPSANQDEANAAARATVAANQVWGLPPGMANENDLTFPTCPSGLSAPTGQCVQAQVHREAGNPAALPIYIAAMFGLAPTGVRALATAAALPANSTSCLRPWAIPDPWVEAREVNMGDPLEYDMYETPTPGRTVPVELPTPIDQYTPPSSSSPGSGLQKPGDFGQRWLFSFENNLAATMLNENYRLPRNLAIPLDFSGTGNVAVYQDDIETCRGTPFAIDGNATPLTTAGAGETQVAVDALIAMDPLATWNGQRVINSQFTLSPRIVPIAVFDSDHVGRLLAVFPRTTTLENILPIRNVVGFFVEPMVGGSLQGVIIPMPGEYDPSAPSLADEASFLRMVRLLR